MSAESFHLSFEFFPPSTSRGLANLTEAAHRLNQFSPEFFSVTYGAGGSTKTRTSETVEELISRGFVTVPHLSWGDTTRDLVVEQIKKYQKSDVSGFVLLRGDTPSGTVAQTVHHAVDLVNLVRSEFGNAFKIFVAAYPEMHPDAPNPSRDIEFLREKVDAGADACFTQYFYNSDAYFYFVEACRGNGIDVPIIPGIMPITNCERLVRFSRNCGAEIPRWIESKMFEYKDDQASLEDFGCDVVQSLCQRLVDNDCPGFHFYTLNRARATTRILRSLDY
ncbi:MAG: methylenetetrahydrofolate reductase [NAD(P)H] [Gammaproteobacteria bacterium]|nr:methylenetetrahydrofolate reductase [NAD(P)H] [Gammaproteobacteria bacterium]